jgi:RNA polymerase sigma-70 factor (ECF subfamily)
MARVIVRADSLHSPREGSTPGAAGDAVTADDVQAIYREHYSALWRFLLHLGVPRSDVPDVTHNVFLIAFRRLSTFEQRSSLRTWLCGIALRVGRDHLRSAAVRLEVSAADPTLSAGASAPADHGRRDDRLELAERLLDSLSAEQREVFVLHELEQMTGSEIAALMGTSVGTVRSRLRRARDSVRKQLEALKHQGAFDV